jgi:hypothetical protein
VRGGTRGKVARGKAAGQEGSASVWRGRVSRAGLFVPAEN